MADEDAPLPPLSNPEPGAPAQAETPVPGLDALQPGPVETEEQKRGRGRPPYEPAGDDRDTVVGMCRANYTKETIAEYLNISVDTLNKYYPDELRTSKKRMVTVAASKLYQNAIRGDQRAVEFILRMQGEGWNAPTALSGPNGESLFKDLKLGELPDEKFEQLKDLLRGVGLVVPGDPGGRETPDTEGPES
jgi:hypothetical protein